MQRYLIENSCVPEGATFSVAGLGVGVACGFGCGWLPGVFIGFFAILNNDLSVLSKIVSKK